MRSRASVRIYALAQLLALLLAATAAAGCGRTTLGTTSAATPTASTAPGATATATARPITLELCPHPLDPTTAAIGAQTSSAVARLGDQAYASYHVPENVPLKPLAIASNLTDQDFTVNPDLMGRGGGGYVFAVCNTSGSASYSVTGITVKIAHVTPYTGQLNAWNRCTGFYRSGSLQDAGCGGGSEMDDEYLNAGFAANAGTGASVTATFSDAGLYSNTGPLPVTVGPNKSLSFDIGITAPTTPGTYTFAFGIVIEGAAPAYLVTSQPMLLAPVAHKWTGFACGSPAMQSQMPPPTNPPSSYICPEA